MYKTAKIPKSSKILLVVACAILGYCSTYYVIKTHTVQYTQLPHTIPVFVKDYQGDAKSKKGQRYVEFQLSVHRLLPIDSAKTVTVYKNRLTTTADCETKTVTSEDNILFHELPIFLIWATLICIMMAIAAGSFPVFIYQLKDLKDTFNLDSGKFLSSFIYTILLLLFIFLTNSGRGLKGYYSPDLIINKYHILFTNGNILSYIICSTLILLIPCICVIFLVALASDTIIENKNPDFTSIKKSIQQLNFLNKKLENALQLLAVIIVFSVLTSGALGETMRAIFKIDGFNIFPKEISYVYGTYFSLFLCIIYVPVYYYIKLNYEELKDQASTIEETAAEKGTYDKIFGEVRFKNTPLENVKLALTVLSPLLTSLLPSHVF